MDDLKSFLTGDLVSFWEIHCASLRGFLQLHYNFNTIMGKYLRY